MLLAVDIGNSEATAGLFDGTTISTTAEAVLP